MKKQSKEVIYCCQKCCAPLCTLYLLSHLFSLFQTVNAVELKRLKDAFSKHSTSSGLLQQNVFLSDILGETVPNNLAEVSQSHICETKQNKMSQFFKIHSQTAYLYCLGWNTKGNQFQGPVVRTGTSH
jgi:hypothetical protein